jgi:hypothetical protein
MLWRMNSDSSFWMLSTLGSTNWFLGAFNENMDKQTICSRALRMVLPDGKSPALLEKTSRAAFCAAPGAPP